MTNGGDIDSGASLCVAPLELSTCTKAIHLLIDKHHPHPTPPNATALLPMDTFIEYQHFRRIEKYAYPSIYACMWQVVATVILTCVKRALKI